MPRPNHTLYLFGDGGPERSWYLTDLVYYQRSMRGEAGPVTVTVTIPDVVRDAVGLGVELRPTDTDFSSFVGTIVGARPKRRYTTLRINGSYAPRRKAPTCWARIIMEAP
jgi:hypothetical protein